MDSYTFGSAEGITALKNKLAESEIPHHLQFSPALRRELASSLETAWFAGKPWGETYTGIPGDQAQFWPAHLADMELDNEEVLGLVDALVCAWHLGDETSAELLATFAVAEDIEWI